MYAPNPTTQRRWAPLLMLNAAMDGSSAMGHSHSLQSIQSCPSARRVTQPGPVPSSVELLAWAQNNFIIRPPCIVCIGGAVLDEASKWSGRPRLAKKEDGRYSCNGEHTKSRRFAGERIAK